MKRLFVILLFIPVMFLHSLGFAQIKTDEGFEQQKGKVLLNVLKDTTILSEYRNFKGMKNKSYDFTELHNADGTTNYTERGSDQESGLWKIIGGDKVCYQYPNSPRPNEKHCFFVYKQGQCYYNYSRRAMSPQGPINYDYWTSRFVRKGSGGTCGDVVG